ncbi:3-hydroxyisobutyrate dehydrogenase [Tardiphaga sp. OK246]|uniref:NAD(P)-dependent oxidoreductase n=1 Tax=Tardiphaga sp. OK246 TaxID=1855307 RepID=UPI000B73B4EC|nr:NAD(P)-dependent oxidoreductase [Tardiphaga sp. OK246]SNT32688.1 3-hydroxyisobutyrate dehydrogenase [Tardiphaga sp. OK246]
MNKIAFIGAGNIGGRMARRVIDAGLSVKICDLNPMVRNQFARHTAQVTAEPRDCADCEVVIVMVATGQQIKDALLATGGFLTGVDLDNPPIVVLMSTVTPDIVRDVQSALASAGVQVIDAPVSGGLIRAEDGRLTIMAGGDDAAINAVTPIFEIMGRRIFRCGGTGSGALVKVINNVISVAIYYLGAEAFQLALRHGLSLERIAPVLEVSSGRNFFTVEGTNIAQEFGVWADERANFDSLGDIIRKDLSLGQQLSKDVGLSLPVLGALAQSVSSLDNNVFERWQEIAASGSY